MSGDSIRLPRKHVEELALAATAWSTMLAMKRALGQPLVPQGASMRVDGGESVSLNEEQIDLDALMEAVVATRRTLGWRK